MEDVLRELQVGELHEERIAHCAECLVQIGSDSAQETWTFDGSSGALVKLCWHTGKVDARALRYLVRRARELGPSFAASLNRRRASLLY